MNSPYIVTVPPQQQDQQGLMPVFQNTNAQQQYLANQLREQQQSGHRGQSGGSSGMNPMDLAKMLKNGQQANSLSNGMSNPYSFGGSTSNNLSAYTPWNQSATANTYGTDPYSQQSIMLGQQDAGLSDAPWSANMGDWFSGIGDSLGSAGSSIGDFFGGIGSWFGSEAAPAVGEALPAIGTAAEEAAPVAAAAA